MRRRGTVARLVAVVVGSILVTSCGADPPAATESSSARVSLGPAPGLREMNCGITLRQFEAIVGGTWRLGNFGTKSQCLFEQGRFSVSMGRHRTTPGFAANAAREIRTINPKATCTPSVGYRRLVCSSTTEVSGISYHDGVFGNVLALGDALHGPLSSTDQRRLEVIVEKILDAL